MDDTASAWFAFRVAGVAIHEEHVLLQRDGGTWFLPGGRVELLELARDGLGREMREELGVAVEVGRMLWLFEGFSHLWGKTRHELSLAFLMSLPPGPLRDSKAQPIVRLEQHGMLHFAWHPLARLQQLSLYPPCLQQRLRHLPLEIEHIVQSTPCAAD
jgi:ADP-ribose pyrophosphatase YjhB (NUDIX family)